MPNEIDAASAYLYQRLSTDATLTGLVSTRIYSRRAPQRSTGVTVYPYVLYSWQGGDDTATLDQVRLLVELLFWVRVVTSLDGNSSSIPLAAKQAEDRIDVLLQTGRRITYPAVVPGYSFNSWRERARQMSEPAPGASGGEILQLGGDFRVQVFTP